MTNPPRDADVRRVVLRLLTDPGTREALRNLMELDGESLHAEFAALPQAERDAFAAFPPEDIGHGVRFDHRCGRLIGNVGSAHLTPIEADLLAYLVAHAGSIVRKDDLVQFVWRFPSSAGSDDFVRSHIKNLRQKLRRVAPVAEFIRTFNRRGYAFERSDAVAQVRVNASVDPTQLAYFK